MPRLAHWFGLTWETHLVAMPIAEIRVYVDALADLPPMGGVVMYAPKE